MDYVHGLLIQPNGSETLSLVLRGSLGAFFTISGYHKLFNSGRRDTLRQTFIADGCYHPAMMWVIPLGEFFGGLALLLGLFTHVAAAGLIAICLGACWLDGIKRVKASAPLDKADFLDDVLYLPETLYVIMLTCLVITGPGWYSADGLMVQWLGRQ